MHRAAGRGGEVRQDGFAPFVYEQEGRRRLPFAQAFVSESSKERNRVYPFQSLGVRGSLLAQLLPACDLLVMNDRSPDEVVLSGSDSAARQRPDRRD